MAFSDTHHIKAGCNPWLKYLQYVIYTEQLKLPDMRKLLKFCIPDFNIIRASTNSFVELGSFRNTRFGVSPWLGKTRIREAWLQREGLKASASFRDFGSRLSKSFSQFEFQVVLNRELEWCNESIIFILLVIWAVFLQPKGQPPPPEGTTFSLYGNVWRNNISFLSLPLLRKRTDE